MGSNVLQAGGGPPVDQDVIDIPWFARMGSVGIKSELLLDLFEKCVNINAKDLLNYEARERIV